MSSSDSRLLTLAKKEAQEAVALDAQGQYNQAMNKYFRAAEILIQFTKYNKNPIMLKKCEVSIQEYLNRAKSIKDKLSGSRARKGGAARSSKADGDA